MNFITNALEQNIIVNLSCLFTDTDSLIYEIETDDIYENLKVYLILVIIQKIQNFLILSIKK